MALVLIRRHFQVVGSYLDASVKVTLLPFRMTCEMESML